MGLAIGIGIATFAAEPAGSLSLSIEPNPAVGTVQTQTSSSRMEGGKYVGVRNRVPTQWQVSNRESRVVQLARVTEETLEVRVLDGTLLRSEKIETSESSTEKKNPLIGKSIKFARSGERWVLQREGLPSDLDALKEADRIETRLNNRYALFGERTAASGESWKFNPEGLIKSAGFPDARLERGEGTAKLTEIKDGAGRVEFGVDAAFSIQNDYIASARLDAKVKGVATLDTATNLQRSLSLEGELQMIGEVYQPDPDNPDRRVKSPFEFRFPVQYESARSVTKIGEKPQQ